MARAPREGAVLAARESGGEPSPPLFTRWKRARVDHQRVGDVVVTFRFGEGVYALTATYGGIDGQRSGLLPSLVGYCQRVSLSVGGQCVR